VKKCQPPLPGRRAAAEIPGMELIPSERAVLRQIRDLFLESSVRTYRMTVLTGRWPPVHYDAYRNGFAGLISKRLVESDGVAFTITNAGLRAML
jgi:hypothetical protein